MLQEINIENEDGEEEDELNQKLTGLCTCIALTRVMRYFNLFDRPSENLLPAFGSNH